MELLRFMVANSILKFSYKVTGKKQRYSRRGFCRKFRGDMVTLTFTENLYAIPPSRYVFLFFCFHARRKRGSKSNHCKRLVVTLAKSTPKRHLAPMASILLPREPI